MQKDADLFLSWAADAFVAAGRAAEPEQRLHHRRRAELFGDIFDELSRRPAVRSRAKDPAGIGMLLGKAFGPEEG